SHPLFSPRIVARALIQKSSFFKAHRCLYPPPFAVLLDESAGKLPTSRPSAAQYAKGDDRRESAGRVKERGMRAYRTVLGVALGLSALAGGAPPPGETAAAQPPPRAPQQAGAPKG